MAQHQAIITSDHWLHRQLRQLKEQGGASLPRKARKLLVIALAALPALVLIIIIRALKPLVFIRLGPLMSQRIGHFAANTEIYLCELEATQASRRFIDIFYLTSPVSNAQLAKMWRRVITIAPAGIGAVIWVADAINRRFRGGAVHAVSLVDNRARDCNGYLSRTGPHLSFTDIEEGRGREALLGLGLPEGAPFVCFHARDSLYLERMYRGGNHGYHSYRDCHIKNYLPAIEELTNCGYIAVRMGSAVEETLETDNPKIIDYATSGKRTDFLDIYLGASCSFMLCSDAGIYAIPAVFRRPIVFTNFVPMEPVHSWGWNYLTIFKKLRSRLDDRYLTFGEIVESGIGRFDQTDQYERAGIDVVENTPEEITAVVVEMEERLKGTWRTTEDDEERQRQFWALLKNSDMHKVRLSRIGSEFLRQNWRLLR